MKRFVFHAPVRIVERIPLNLRRGRLGQRQRAKQDNDYDGGRAPHNSQERMMSGCLYLRGKYNPGGGLFFYPCARLWLTSLRAC